MVVYPARATFFTYMGETKSPHLAEDMKRSVQISKVVSPSPPLPSLDLSSLVLCHTYTLWMRTLNPNSDFSNQEDDQALPDDFLSALLVGNVLQVLNSAIVGHTHLICLPLSEVTALCCLSFKLWKRLFLHLFVSFNLPH